jgi:hypothetical protein
VTVAVVANPGTAHGKRCNSRNLLLQVSPELSGSFFRRLFSRRFFIRVFYPPGQP